MKRMKKLTTEQDESKEIRESEAFRKNHDRDAEAFTDSERSEPEGEIGDDDAQCAAGGRWGARWATDEGQHALL